MGPLIFIQLLRPTINIHNTSSEQKMVEKLITHLENMIVTIWTEYFAVLVAIVIDALGECCKAHWILAAKYTNIIFLDCYAHQVCPIFICELLLN